MVVPAPSSILLVRLSALGDCIHAVPVAWALREAFPAARIGWAIQPGPRQLLGEHPAIDRFHLITRRGPLRARLAALAELRDSRYQVAIDLQGLAKSALVTRASGAPRRIGWARGDSRELSWLALTEPVAVEPAIRHVVDRNLALLRPLGIDRPPVRFELPLEPPARARIHAWLAERDLAPRRFVVLNPGTTWVTKTWPTPSWIALARGLVASGASIVVSWGTAAERAVASEIAVASGCQLAPPTSLPELSALLAAARLVVAGDTGPLHLAVAHGIATVGLYGATDPARTGPWDDGSGRHQVVIDAGLDCRPCGARECSRHDVACLTALPVAAVLAACGEQLRTG